MAVAGDVLTQRALGRATLARQLLLERSAITPLAAIDRLVGLQAQVPLNPYTALWSRLANFDPHELGRLLTERAVVRIVVMRGTIHLVTADDALVLRPLVQPVLDQELARHSDHAPHLDGVDLKPVMAFARPLFAERPRTGPELRGALAERFPDLSAPALAYACRNKLALVQVPPRGVWQRSGPVTSTTTDAWLGRAIAKKPSIDDVALRYFAAFGPATVADLATWSRLTGLREVVERLRPKLRTFRDDRGRELFDLDEAPRPDPESPAPARFLPEYDNVLLSHADRSRFIAGDTRAWLAAGTGPVHGTVLFDGAVAGTWSLTSRTKAGTGTLALRYLDRTKAAIAAIEREGKRLEAFLTPK